jgi:hypothetical protein
VIASYSDLLTQIMRLMSGDDVSATNLPFATLQQVVNMAERRIYREVRSRHNEKAFTGLTATSNAAAIPADFEAASVVYIDGQPLQPVTEEWMREYLDANPSGDARFFCEAGANFIFGPALADGTAVNGRYFCRLDDLSATTFSGNALIAQEPDLFIYAALTEGAPFFAGQGTPPQLWEAKYQAVVDRLNEAKQRAAANAGRLVIRPSTRIMG